MWAFKYDEFVRRACKERKLVSPSKFSEAHHTMFGKSIPSNAGVLQHSLDRQHANNMMAAHQSYLSDNVYSISDKSIKQMTGYGEGEDFDDGESHYTSHYSYLSEDGATIYDSNLENNLDDVADDEGANEINFRNEMIAQSAMNDIAEDFEARRDARIGLRRGTRGDYLVRHGNRYQNDRNDARNALGGSIDHILNAMQAHGLFN